MTPEDRFWNKVDRRSFSECWPWTASLDSRGYGHIWWEGKLRTASRVSWMINKGPVPPGRHVLHRCDNLICVNPNHLFVGSHEDNMADMAQKGRRRGGVYETERTHCPRGHEYSPTNTWVNKRGKRACKACNREKHTRMRDRRRSLGLPAKGPWVSE